MNRANFNVKLVVKYKIKKKRIQITLLEMSK